MAHAQKPYFVFRRNGRVHLNRWWRQFSRLLAAEVCAWAVVMLDTPSSEVVEEYWLHTPFASFPFTSPPVRHRVPSHFNWTLPVVQQGGWAAGRVWTREGKRQFLATVWVLFPSPRVISESLYQLSYLGTSFYSGCWIDCREIRKFREVIRFGKRE